MSEKIKDMKANILRLLSENTELKQERDEAREVASGLAIQEERVNEAQKELSSIHQWIERNHPDGFIDSLTYFQNLERVTDNWYDRLDRLEVDAHRFVRERDEAREQNANLKMEIEDTERAFIATENSWKKLIKENAKLRDIAERAVAGLESKYKLHSGEDIQLRIRDELNQLKEGEK